MFLSIVVPVYNEEENIAELYKQIKEVIVRENYNAEVIFVDDGSTDKTYDELYRLSKEDKRVKIVRFRKNFGQTAAFAAGFDYAKGDVIISMDGDLQNDPKDIPNLLRKIEEGYDVVSGRRKKRKDHWSRVLPSKIANWLIGKISGVKLHDYGCSLKAYRRDVAKNLHLYGELHRFIPVLASIFGARICEIPVVHHPRLHGKSKYNFSRTLRVIVDLLLVAFMQKFSTKPLHVFGIWGFILFATGVVIDLVLFIEKIFWGVSIGSRPLLFLGILLILGGLQLISIGILAEMNIRTYYESQGKKIYNVRNTVNIDEES